MTTVTVTPGVRRARSVISRQILCMLFVSGCALCEAEQPKRTLAEISRAVNRRLSRVRSLHVKGRWETDWNPRVRGLAEQFFRQAHPNEPSPFGPLRTVRTFDFAMDGTKVLMRTLSDDVATEATAEAPLATSEVFDGHRYVGVFPQGNLEVPAIVNTQRSAVAKPNQFEVATALGLFWRNRPLDDALKDEETRASVESTATVESRVCTVVAVHERGVSSQLFLAEELAFMPVRVEEYDETGELIYVSEFGDWVEQDGQPIPARVTRTKWTRVKDYGEKLPEVTERVECKSIMVNEELPHSLFEVDLDRLPKGSEVIELDTGRVYFAGVEVTEQDVVNTATKAKAFLDGDIELADLTQQVGKGMSYERMCGPYALLMLCTMQGIDASLEELAGLAGADNKGVTSLAGLVAAARAKKLPAVGVKLSFEELAQLEEAAIVHLSASAGHFALFVRSVRGGIVLIDPPTRLVVLLRDDFLKVWDGVALVVRHETVNKPRNAAAQERM